MRIFKQSTAATISIGPCLDSAGAEYTGLVIGDLTITKAGTSAAMASAATLTHTSNGHYDLVFTTGNLDTLGTLRVRCNKATYQIPPIEGTVWPATAYDAVITNGTLASTTSGRVIDTTAGGAVGIDWANVENPTTTVGLSGTTVKTATDVETDTADIQSRIPAALGANGNIKADVRDYSGTAGTFSSGRPEVNTTHAAGTAWGSGAITAASIADGAIDAATFAADTGLKPIRSGTAQIGTSSSITLDTGASSVTDFYYGCIVIITGGAGVGNFGLITAYNGTTKVATVAQAWKSGDVLDATSTFAIHPSTTNVAAWVGTLVQNNGGRPSVSTDYESGVQLDGSGAGVPARGILDFGLAQAMTTTTLTLRSAAAFGDNELNGCTLLFRGSDLIWHKSQIASNVGSTDVVTLEASVTVPSGSIIYKVFAGLADLTATMKTSVQTSAAAALTAYDPPTQTELLAAHSTTDGLITTVDTVVDGLATSVDALPTNAELATALGTADDATLAAIAALNNISTAQVTAAVPTAAAIATAVRTGSAMTEAYAADGVAPTLEQCLFLIQQKLCDFSISGTTLTVKKLDGSTTAATFTLDSSTAPTSITRAS